MPAKSKVTTSIANLGKALDKVAERKSNIPDVTPQAPEPVKLGRKKRNTVKRNNANTIYFTDEMQHLVNEIEYTNRVGKQELIRAALHHFFSQYKVSDQDAINAEGMAVIREYEKLIEI